MDLHKHLRQIDSRQLQSYYCSSKEPVDSSWAQLRKKLMDAVVEATGAGTVTVIGGAARFEFGRDRFVPMVLRVDPCGNFSRQVVTLPQRARSMAPKTRHWVADHSRSWHMECGGMCWTHHNNIDWYCCAFRRLSTSSWLWLLWSSSSFGQDAMSCLPGDPLQYWWRCLLGALGRKGTSWCCCPQRQVRDPASKPTTLLSCFLGNARSWFDWLRFDMRVSYYVASVWGESFDHTPAIRPFVVVSDSDAVNHFPGDSQTPAWLRGPIDFFDRFLPLGIIVWKHGELGKFWMRNQPRSLNTKAINPLKLLIHVLVAQLMIDGYFNSGSSLDRTWQCCQKLSLCQKTVFSEQHTGKGLWKKGIKLCIIPYCSALIQQSQWGNFDFACWMSKGHLGFGFWFVDSVLGARTDYLNCGKPSASGGTEMEADTWNQKLVTMVCQCQACKESCFLSGSCSTPADNEIVSLFSVLWVQRHKGCKGLLMHITVDWIPLLCQSWKRQCQRQSQRRRRQQAQAGVMVSVNLLKLLHIVSGFPPNDPNGFPQWINESQSLVNLCRIRWSRRLRPLAGWKRSEQSLVVAITEYHLIENLKWTCQVPCRWSYSFTLI